jgi:hypothetical protein
MLRWDKLPRDVELLTGESGEGPWRTDRGGRRGNLGGSRSFGLNRDNQNAAFIARPTQHESSAVHDLQVRGHHRFFALQQHDFQLDQLAVHALGFNMQDTSAGQIERSGLAESDMCPPQKLPA